MTSHDDIPVERESISDSKGRYFMRGPGGAVAEMTYSRSGAKTLIIDHTEVPGSFRGQGAGLTLLERLIEDARRDGLKIIPICPFAAAQFHRHPEWADILAFPVRGAKG